MSTLLELQRQLRQVTEDYYTQMLMLTRELAMTAQEMEDDRKQIDFQRLAKLGSSRPLHHRWLKEVDENLRDDYLTFLCAVAQSAPEMDNGWLLLQRIACGVGVTSLESRAVAAMCMEEGDMERISGQICQNGLRDVFLLDAMLLRLACPSPCPKTEALLVDLSTLLECPSDDLRFLSQLAAVLAGQDGDAYLSMGVELGERDWLGLEYIQENAGILYTDQFSKVKEHGFRNVILHDCTIDEKDISSDLIELKKCCLFNCKLNVPAKIVLTDCIACQCTFQFPISNQYYGQLSAIITLSALFDTNMGMKPYQGKKMKLNTSIMFGCLVVCAEEGTCNDFFEFNGTASTGIQIHSK